MAKYIDKSALVAEIERLQCFFVNERDDFEKGYHHILRLLKSFLDTLEVKEVDLEYNGKAMLHVLTKGVEQGKREILDKACEWLKKNRKNYSSNALGEKYLIDDFKKAMKEE